MKNKLFILNLLLVLSKVVFGQTLFYEDFEADLSQWEYQEEGIAQIIKTDDPQHHSVLQLTPNKTADCILIKNSDQWDKIVIQGQALFPSEQHDYLGLVYNYIDSNRIDFGCIYIKGKGSYIRVNPHRDGNASRALYEEYKRELTGNTEIKTNQWFSFKAEVIGNQCHFYVIDMEKPKVVFKYLENKHGKIGFKPRLAGGAVWIDQISVGPIIEFSCPNAIGSNEAKYHRNQMINDWRFLGPFNYRIVEVEQSEQNLPFQIHQEKYEWEIIETDARGCLLAGTVCRYKTDEKFAYFSAEFDSKNQQKAQIQASSLNKLHVWVNTKYVGFIEKQEYAWFDFVKNPKHAGKSIPINLKKGINRILVMVEGANYSGDGFYMHLKL